MKIKMERARIIAIQKVRKDWRILKTLQCDDYEVVLAAVEHYGKAIRWASGTLKNNEPLVRIAMKSCPKAYKYISHKLQRKSLCLLAVTTYERAFTKIAPAAWLKDRKFVLQVLDNVSIVDSRSWDSVWEYYDDDEVHTKLVKAGYIVNRYYYMPQSLYAHCLQRAPKYVVCMSPDELTTELITIALDSAISQYNSCRLTSYNRGMHRVLLEKCSHSTELLIKLAVADSCFLQDDLEPHLYLNREFVITAVHIRLSHLNNMYPHKLVGKKIVKNKYYIPITNNVLTNARFIGEMTHSLYGNRKLLYMYGAIMAVSRLPHFIGDDVLEILSKERW